MKPEIMDTVCKVLLDALPNVLGIYAFGSRDQGTANKDSDLDLGVLVAGCAQPLQLWELENQLANKLGFEVDLLDLRVASTVMQYQVITTGTQLWKKTFKPNSLKCTYLAQKRN